MDKIEGFIFDFKQRERSLTNDTFGSELTYIDVSRGQFASRSKVDPDELALWGKCEEEKKESMSCSEKRPVVSRRVGVNFCSTAGTHKTGRVVIP